MCRKYDGLILLNIFMSFYWKSLSGSDCYIDLYTHNAFGSIWATKSIVKLFKLFAEGYDKIQEISINEELSLGKITKMLYHLRIFDCKSTVL